MRFCNGCTQFDKRLTNFCKKGFEVVLGKTKVGIRPNKCKKKYKKENKIDWKKRAVDAFQMYIRYRDNWTCVVCGKHIDPNEKGAKLLLQAGHYISRTKTSLLLDEKNVNAQCRECNGRQYWEGLDPRYTKYLINKYGADVLDYFAEKKNKICKTPESQWQVIANYWEAELERIKKQKSC